MNNRENVHFKFNKNIFLKISAISILLIMLISVIQIDVKKDTISSLDGVDTITIHGLEFTTTNEYGIEIYNPEGGTSGNVFGIYAKTDIYI